MDRGPFERRLRVATARAVDLARGFIEEPLPDAVRFNVHLNSSHDAGAGPAFALFPEDSSAAVALRTKGLSAEQVVDVLWRDGLVPQWIDVGVVGETGEETLVDLTACGRFTGDEQALYYSWTDVAPFGVKGPWLPVNHVQGQRFSIYHRAACWSLDQLVRTMRHAPKVWSLELHGSWFDDEVLATALASPSLELLELDGAPIRGPGLRGLTKLPKLRVLRMTLDDIEGLSLSAFPGCAHLEHLAVRNLPPVVTGVAGLAACAPSLTSLSLEGSGGSSADATLAPPALAELSLRFPHVPSWVEPGPRVRTLGIHAPASDDREVGALLERAPRQLEHLHLRGTPVTDALLEALVTFGGLRYLDVVDTAITAAALERFRGARPSLRTHPRLGTSSTR